MIRSAMTWNTAIKRSLGKESTLSFRLQKQKKTRGKESEKKRQEKKQEQKKGNLIILGNSQQWGISREKTLDHRQIILEICCLSHAIGFPMES